MKNKPFYTTIGLLLSLTALLILAAWKLILIASIIALAGYFVAMKHFSKFTSNYQFTTQILSSLILGIALEYPFDKIPFFLLTILFATMATIGRIIFFKIFTYTGKTWFEPSAITLSLLFYLTGNLIYTGNLLTWIAPIPVIIFGILITWGVVKDKQQLLAKTVKGYKITIGAIAPSFALPDQKGNLISLSDFRGKRHLLLIFVRGDWCPGCHMMLRTYQKDSERFKEKNVFVLSIGPDPVGVNREMVERLDLSFNVLADEGQKTAMQYGVQTNKYDNDFAEKYEEGIPLPASFLIDKSGVVRYVSRPDKIGEFLNPSLIFPIVETLN